MSKKVFVLVHDYWHHDDSIKPMMDYLFNADYEVTFTKNPNDYFNGQFDLFLSFKDPIENDQIPTPIWCDEKWTEKIGGMKIYNEKQLRTALEAVGFRNVESHSDAKKHWLCIVAKK